jgi:signal transduction histidine kinase
MVGRLERKTVFRKAAVRAGSAPRAGALRRRGAGSAASVAVIATLLAGVVFVGAAFALNAFVADRLVAQVDRQLANKLGKAAKLPPSEATAPSKSSGGSSGQFGLGIYGEPIYLWQVSPGGDVDPSHKGVPAIPGGAWSRTGPGSSTVDVAGTQIRLMAVRYRGGLLVAGESLAELEHVESVLTRSELAAVPILLIVVFAAALVIGLRSAAPIELARRRQLEFTSDASHELRTPISVIEAELALAEVEPAVALDHIAHETSRLRRIVEDLLWLARVDSLPPSPGSERVDVVTLVEASAERFHPVASARGVTLDIDCPPSDAATIVAPAEWVDRLAGALVDNACKYAGRGGSVRVEVRAAGGRVVLAVEDSGPGLPAGMEGRRLFDRFRRGTTEGGGHGLGLAIADLVVTSTGGRWNVAQRSSQLGGARMEVSWPRK